jgi:hypothetical protein
MPKSKNTRKNKSNTNRNTNRNTSSSTINRGSYNLMKKLSREVFKDTWPSELSAIVRMEASGKYSNQVFDSSLADLVLTQGVLDSKVEAVMFLEHYWYVKDQIGYKIKPTNEVSILGRQITLMHRSGLRWSIVVFPGTDKVMISPDFHQDATTVRLQALFAGVQVISQETRAQAALTYIARMIQIVPSAEVVVLRETLLSLLSLSAPEELLAACFDDLVARHLADCKMKPTELARAENDVLNLLGSRNPLEVKETLFTNVESSEHERQQFDRIFGLAA